MSRPLLVAALATAALPALAPIVAQTGVPSPKEFLGHDIGEDYFLANYTQLRSYWRELERRSNRMIVETFGKTSYGQPMIAAIISSPDNLARLDEIRAVGARLARGRDADERIARVLAEGGRSVIWIDAGLHASESVAAQNILELVYRMTSRDDAEVRRILDEVVLVACPANPDGMELISNAYMATGNVGGIPVLYQKYVGHDNNRDFYAVNQAESRAISRMFYDRWYPQVVYNHHQTAPRGTIIFTPPFRDPFNYNIDPLVVRGIGLVANHINYRFAAEAKPGVISRSGGSYSTWWNGGLRTAVYFHNMIGILTETFGSPTPTEVRQPINRRLPFSDYPDPVPSQEWHARQTIEYLQTANFAILDFASRYRRELMLNIWRMARRSIARGERDHWTMTPKLVAAQQSRRGGARDSETEAEVVDAFSDPLLRDPRHYVLPRDAADFSAATRLVRALRRSGVEVRRTTEPLELSWRDPVPSGSFVVDAAQAYRPHLRDMFEPQWHPDDIGASGTPVRPYDLAGWTLAMQMGVTVERCLDPIDVESVPVDEVEVPFSPAAVTSGSQGWLLSRADINSYIAVNRLLAAGDSVTSLEQPFDDGERSWPAGSFFVRGDERTEQRAIAIAAELGTAFIGVESRPDLAVRSKPVRRQRIGLFDVYGGDMATGWTQWMLEQYEFDFDLVFGATIEEGALQDRFDVLLFQTGLPSTSQGGRRGRGSRRGRRAMTTEDLDKLRSALPSFEDWSTIEARRVRPTNEKAVPALREFVEAGGSLLAFGQQAQRAVELLDLPVEVGVFVEGDDGERRAANGSEFFIPGSLLWTDIDTDDPSGYGASARAAAMFRRGPVFGVDAGSNAKAIATYAERDALASGWAIGEELVQNKGAVVRAPLGKGRVYLFGADVTFRGQPAGTFKLVFNALY